MSFDRPLRGGCHCGRNLYIIQFPANYTHSPSTTGDRTAQVLFNSHPSHHLSSLATPLPSYLRVPLAWYHTLTLPHHADETRAQIRRVYDDEARRAKRHFCGFCGTPLSFWCEEPRTEAEFIQLTLGSLWPEDLGDLEELGFLSGGSESGSEVGSPAPGPALGGLEEGGGGKGGRGEVEEGGDVDMAEAGERDEVARGGVGMMGRVRALPWFDALTEGSKLGRLRRARGGGTNRSGTVRVEWEVVEWTEDETGSESPRKRKLEDVEGVVEEGRMEGV